MKIEYDPAKRQLTIERRGLDFEDVVGVLAGFHLTRADNRKDYGEDRNITVGMLKGRPVVVVWTRREDAVRVISMRMADHDERRHYKERLDRSG